MTAAGCGWGSTPDVAKRDAMKAMAAETGKMFADEGIAAAAAKYADAPMRQAFKHKDPRGWAEFARMLAEHSAAGHAHTMLNLQLKRPTLWEMEEELRGFSVPLLVIVGDEDDLCLDGSVFLKRTVPTAALLVIPRAGHTINSEEPAAVNAALARAVCRRRGRPLARAQAGLSRYRTSTNTREETDMDLQLKGKTALVTGGSEGIGKGIARVLAKEGVDVAICARRKEPLEQAAAEIRAETGRKIFAITADLTKDADCKNFVEQGHKALGRVDIMVNNAGSAPGGVIEHLTEKDWEQSLQLKFMGYVRCLRYVLPIMVKQGGGRVVNLIGNDGVKPSYWEIAPGAANAAGQNLTISLAGQYGKHNISFCAVNPGPVRTERWSGLVSAMARDMKLPYEEADKLAPSSIPLGPHRRGRGGRQSRGHAGVAADAHGQRHADRDRRRPGEVADGPAARPQVTSRRAVGAQARPRPGRSPNIGARTARSSILTSFRTTSTICAQTKWRTDPSMPDQRPMDSGCGTAQGRPHVTQTACFHLSIHVQGSLRMRSHLLRLAVASAAAACLTANASAQGTLKIGELNSYKSQPAFLDPYKKGWELAIEEINAKGGVLGKKLEVRVARRRRQSRRRRARRQRAGHA